MSANRAACSGSSRQVGAALAIGIACVVLVVSGCHAEQSAPSATTPAFPYPPFEIQTDVAVPLRPPLDGAARFALEMSALALRSNDPDEEELRQQYRSSIAPEEDSGPTTLPDPYIGSTGGAVHRAIAAQQLPDGLADVTVCLYNTPGLYVMEPDGELIKAPSTGPLALWRPRVQWTDRPAADGSKPAQPRWLLVDLGVLLDKTKEQVAEVCDPFKPQPFVQEAPEPTSPPAG